MSDWFASVHGRRKAILFVSEGIDYDINDPFANNGNNSATTIIDETRELIASATRANVAIYGIDPRGLTDLGDESITVGSFPDDTSLGVGASSTRRFNARPAASPFDATGCSAPNAAANTADDGRPSSISARVMR